MGLVVCLVVDDVGDTVGAAVTTKESSSIKVTSTAGRSVNSSLLSLLFKSLFSTDDTLFVALSSSSPWGARDKKIAVAAAPKEIQHKSAITAKNVRLMRSLLLLAVVGVKGVRLLLLLIPLVSS